MYFVVPLIVLHLVDAAAANYNDISSSLYFHGRRVFSLKAPKYYLNSSILAVLIDNGVQLPIKDVDPSVIEDNLTKALTSTGKDNYA